MSAPHTAFMGRHKARPRRYGAMGCPAAARPFLLGVGQGVGGKWLVGVLKMADDTLNAVYMFVRPMWIF